MRIVGGKNKGRRIKVPKKGIRPTKGIVRGAIFNIISDKANDADVLDIFAGSGALGLEAISRGAKSCVFIEKQPKFLFKNIKDFPLLTKKIKVIVCDFRPGLRKVNNKQFSIIFVDPPYHKNYMQDALKLIFKYHLLRNKGIIIAEHYSKEKFTLPDDFSIFKKKQYGKTAISFIFKKDSND